MNDDRPIMAENVRCDACPITCIIKPGRYGACDRYGNVAGALTRSDPHVVLERQNVGSDTMLSNPEHNADNKVIGGFFVTAVGAGTTYPDVRPAPFVVSSRVDDVDMITVVTEGIFSYCGAKVKIDTDRHVGPERALVRAGDEAVGHVTTVEYGSAMLSIGGVEHLTGGSKAEGRATCKTLLDLCNGQEVLLSVDGGAEMVVAAGQAPVINGIVQERMRAGCGSAIIGLFADHFQQSVDEVVVIDDHITGVLSEHLAGQYLGVAASGIKVRGRRSTSGRYFETAAPGMGWGGTDIDDPLVILDPFNPAIAKPGLRLLMMSTNGDHSGYYVLDAELSPQPAAMPGTLQSVIDIVRENCEPSKTSILFMAGAGGSLRAGVSRNPILLTRAIHDGEIRVTAGGAPVTLWPGGGITFMVDVTSLPANAFGHIPSPAIVAPIEFTMPRSTYERIGGHAARAVPAGNLQDVKRLAMAPDIPWPLQPIK